MPKSLSLHSLLFSLLAVIPAMLLGVILMYTSDNPQSGWNYLSYLFLLGALIYGQLNWRKVGRDGFMTFGQAFKYALMLSMWYAVLIAIWTYIFFAIISPDIMDKMLEISRQQMEAQGLPEDQIEMGLEMSKKFMTPGIIAAFALIGGFIFSLIIGLISSAITQKNNPVPPMFK